ncbi:PAS domain S-box [Thioflavicoccus mobilis 8321]|uniref:PAS domain S-box n=1 Tax=Thioflavicoccus mobilis 8321 TaxID=765912 RepID=L0GWJ1_9GAMM|nr:chemotaxis protein CheB [Thioflavicoccus mobilis]AGA90351.1 PAS domain S-box [Thioflavicoccus mobilis 8321]
MVEKDGREANSDRAEDKVSPTLEEAAPLGEGAQSSDSTDRETDATAEGHLIPEPRRSCVVVGVGASAGGLSAFKRFLRSLPSDSGMAFVLIQHLDPSHESMMAELLSKYTTMPIVQIDEAMPIEPNTVYMIQPNRFVKIEDNGLFVEAPVQRRGVRLPIDYFFSSLARARRERAICVVLSGTGSDGADGLREVKGEGGMTIAQRTEDAEFDGMPSAAVATGAVDHVLAIEEMADAILAYSRHAYVHNHSNGTLASAAPEHFRAILSLLNARTERDFSRYKHGTLARRIERRMGIRHIDSAADYLKLLRSDQEEVHALFKDLLIGVTRFFRDPAAWSELEHILAHQLRDRRSEEAVRVWVPGCATGEEAYSIAMLLFELQERQNKRWDIQVFATDIDSDAIEAARFGLYSENIASDLTEARLTAFFQHDGNKLRVKKRLRETCVFAVQSLLSDAPFSNLDLISCRNLLIYLESDIQQRVLDVFHFGLKPSGLLFLGNSESPNKRIRLFKTLSQPSRVYQKVGTSRPGSGGFPVVSTSRRCLDTLPAKRDEQQSVALGAIERSKRALLEEFAPASVVVNYRGLIQYIHGPVRNYLDFPSGEPELELTTMTLEGLKAKTRSALHQARTSGETVSLVATRIQRDREETAVRIRAQPLPGGKGDDRLFLVSFLDESPPQAADHSADADVPEAPAGLRGSDADEVNRQLVLELAATREDLQSTIEELESANEELKASNEEVMSMNEELQSTNEELETSREELQSLNEELSTVNSQLHDKVGELEAMTNDLTNLLASTDVATLFLDEGLRIRRFTPATMRLMSLLDSDVGRPLSDLASRVDDPELADDARAVLQTLAPIQKEVSKGSSQWFMRRVTPFRTADNKIEGVVVTYSDVTGVKEAARHVELREQQQAAVAQFGRAALAGEDSEALLGRAAKMVVDTLEVDYVKVLRREPEGRDLRLVAGVGWRNGLVGEATVSAGIESQGGYTLQTGGPVVTRDLRKEKRFSGSRLMSDHGILSGMSVLIGPEEAPWGVLSAHARREIDFTVDDTNFMLSVANVLWEAIRREAVETALRANEARTAAFLNNSAVVAWMKDGRGRYVYLSQTFEHRFGIRADDWLGRTDEELWPPEMAAAIHANDRRVREANEALETTETMVVRSGASVHLLVSKFPFTDALGRSCVGGLGVDITDRIEAERALTESEERLRQAARMARFGTYYADVDEGVIYWSAELKEILGYPSDAALETAIGEVPGFVNEADRERVAAALTASLDPVGDGLLQEEYRVVRRDGEIRWLLMQGRTLFQGEGPARCPIQVTGTALDITERHLFEEELRAARTRAEAANEAKSQFLANMSHEIRTPLTAILGFADVLQTRLCDPDDQACINTIKRNGDHLRQILDDFLDLAKIEAGKLSVHAQPCDAVAIIVEIQSLYGARAAQKGLSLTFEPRGELPRQIETDPKCLRQILLNLVGNAIKFTDTGGVQIVVECHAQDEQLAIAVIDSGIGIEQSHLEAVFEAFEQLDKSMTRSAGGTGLGLSITKKLVRALGGEITAESEPEHGSTFHIRIPTGPLAEAEWVIPDVTRLPTGAGGSPNEALPTLKARVLAVDDHRDVRFLVHELIENAGGEVISASDGAQALAVWQREHGQGRTIDAVLIDIQMPGMDGLDTTRQLRAVGCRVPIIALTANAMQRDRDACLEVGCDDFLSKPIERAVLLKKLAGWLHQPLADRTDDEATLVVLCVDDDPDIRATQKTLLELHGHRVEVAGSGAEALAVAERCKPSTALIDLGLGDMSGSELLEQLKRRPELADCLYVCLSGQTEDEAAWRELGFDYYLQKPVGIAALTEVLRCAKPGTKE